jgi:hypothetical protein
MPDKCKWTYDDDGYYDTSCDNAFVFISDGPLENDFKYCPYCGREIEVSEDGSSKDE